MSHIQPDDPEPYTIERDLEFTKARVINLKKETEVLKAAILIHHENRFFMGYDRVNNEILWSTILPGFSANGTTLRDPPYPIKEVK